MELTYAVEPWESVTDELKQLSVIHWAENANFKEKVALDVDWTLYETANHKGMLCFLAVRDGERLVGYYLSNIYHHPHYRSTLYSFNDVYFLLPEYRSAATGVRLFYEYEQAMRQVMRDWRVKKIGLVTRARVAHDPGPILEHLGWDRAEVTYVKLLEAE